jgi:hypothetical protein
MDAMLRAAGSVVVLVGVVGAEAVVCRLWSWQKWTGSSISSIAA